MATFKAEVQNKRADGTYNIRIRITHNREIRRLSTHIFVVGADLTRGLKVKNIKVLEQCEALIAKCFITLCNLLSFFIALFIVELFYIFTKIKFMESTTRF